MSTPDATKHAVADLVFPVAGRDLPRDHAQVLQQALIARLPWLSKDTVTGIHSLKLVPGNDATGLLSRRTRLLLRVDAQRGEELKALMGFDLSVAGHSLRVGVAHWRELSSHGTLYAYKVIAQSADEVEFMATIATELTQLGIKGEQVCGKRQEMNVSGKAHSVFSLMLHQLLPEHSLRLQQQGLGAHRQLGCGIFVPHKSAAAV